MDYRLVTDADSPYVETQLADYALITNPLLNKGTAFSDAERHEFNLLGLLPPHEATLADQRTRSYETLKRKDSDRERYVYMRDLQDSNETLFYSLLVEHIDELLPIVYTPTVGEGCQHFSHIYRRPRGIFLAYPYRDHFDQIFSKLRFDNVRVIVVSDGERILGLGDQGAGGMGIPIGKLALYTACAGVHPSTTLPILLDTGTNNTELLNDPLYIGWRHERVRNGDYADFVDAFIQAVKRRFPNVLLQWEDFAQLNASPLLERYRNSLCTFNDDIQGTAAVATATLLAAVKVTGLALTDQKVVIVGAGSAGTGIAQLVMQAMVHAGATLDAARHNIFLVDQHGLLRQGMPGLLPFQHDWAKSAEELSSFGITHDTLALADVVHHVQPTVLIGVSGQPGIFSEAIVRDMAAHVERPIIFPLSNPTSRCEATPADLLAWTDSRAIVGTGSPFADVQTNGRSVHIDQTNNCYIFPGMGLGLVTVQARRVTDAMFMIAAQALAACSPVMHDRKANLLPSLRDIRKVSFEVALAVAREAIDAGLADAPCAPEALPELLRQAMWTPTYLPYRSRPLKT